ncbi:hypothetical protein [Rossellomorea sp. YZS02]|uniref:hypothetical protein n=1 Tax=Rossellomorea sp. YZS02 TaxID=3097358 RepID=UPI002A151898|nr:hypothetical protein [Rossellomorea sp. YZS02]MDX8342195.1 hypothetical protein [Rossellomorea sp. YZS02]
MAEHVEFQYTHIDGGTWASGFIRIDQSRFEFVCSYLFHNPLQEFLSAIYQLLPGLAAFPRKEISLTMWDEPVKYIWEIKRVDQKDAIIRISEKGYDVKSVLVFEEYVDLHDLIRSVIRCIMRNHALRSNDAIDRMYQEFTVYVKQLK